MGGRFLGVGFLGVGVVLGGVYVLGIFCFLGDDDDDMQVPILFLILLVVQKYFDLNINYLTILTLDQFSRKLCTRIVLLVNKIIDE